MDAKSPGVEIKVDPEAPAEIPDAIPVAEQTKLGIYDTQVEDFLKDSDKFKWDKKGRVVFRQDGGVENVAWLYLILVQPFLAFTFYLILAAVVWAVLASAGVIGYGINAVNDAQNTATDAARTYFRGSNPTA